MRLSHKEYDLQDLGMQLHHSLSPIEENDSMEFRNCSYVHDRYIINCVLKRYEGRYSLHVAFGTESNLFVKDLRTVIILSHSS